MVVRLEVEVRRGGARGSGSWTSGTNVHRWGRVGHGAWPWGQSGSSLSVGWGLRLPRPPGLGSRGESFPGGRA